jgi:hypothetical protein
METAAAAETGAAVETAAAAETEGDEGTDAGRGRLADGSGAGVEGLGPSPGFASFGCC